MANSNQLPAEVPAGYLMDAKGRLVPEHMIKPQERLEDDTVRRIMGYAAELSAQIARFRGHTFDDISTFMSILGDRYGAKKGGLKGNVTLSSYDGTAKVVVQVADRIAFGPELQIAKDLIDECIAAWSEDAAAPIRVLVEHAFTAENGSVNREALLKLRRVEIDDDRWRRAVTAIGDAIRVEGSKAYLRFYRRPHPTAAWEPVSIHIASA